MAHELNHAWQYEIGELSFNEKGEPGLLYDLYDEAESYNVESILIHGMSFFDQTQEIDKYGQNIRFTVDDFINGTTHLGMRYSGYPSERRKANKQYQNMLKELNKNETVEYYIGNIR